ncbi:hypothetical protein pb186bvf_013743 [Paramecium bursaria]
MERPKARIRKITITDYDWKQSFVQQTEDQPFQNWLGAGLCIRRILPTRDSIKNSSKATDTHKLFNTTKKSEPNIEDQEFQYKQRQFKTKINRVGQLFSNKSLGNLNIRDRSLTQKLIVINHQRKPTTYIIQ